MHIVRFKAFDPYFILFVLVMLHIAMKNIYSTQPASTKDVFGNEKCKDISEYDDEENIPDIPQYIYDYIDDIVTRDTFTMTKCKAGEEKVNFAYGKTHKCASDTLAAVWRRFALSRNLSVVLPILGKFLLGWPHNFKYFMHRPAKHENGYNILLDHVTFNYTYIAEIMPKDTVFFTTVREPFSRLGSALNYHGMAKCGRMSPDVDITEEFLNSMFWYDNLYKSPDNMLNLTGCKCIPKGISIARNHMAFDLGFPTGWHYDGMSDQQNNYTFIAEWLKDLNSNFNLLLPTDRFNESMVLLKRYMCWSFKDIIFRMLRKSSKERKSDLDPVKIERFRKWTNVDTLLYYLTKKTFDNRVRTLGNEFKQEVDEYARQETEVLEYCELKRTIGDSLKIPATKWDPGYEFSYMDCELLMDKQHNRDRLKEQYDGLQGDYDEFPIHLGLNLGTYC